MAIGIESSPVGQKMMFMAPQEFQDTINHNWEPMENILSRILDKVGGAKKEIAGGSVQHKVDTALLYQDSNRREVSFTIYLGAYADPQGEIMAPINLLRSYSSPSLGKTNALQTKVGNPHIFSVDTMTGTQQKVPLINMQNAVLLSVQPTFQGPFIKGMPSKCELTLQFKDMEPLSKQTFNNIGSRVTIGAPATTPQGPPQAGGSI